MPISTLKIVVVAAFLGGCLCLTNLMADDAPPLTYHTMKVDGLDIFYRGGHYHSGVTSLG